MFSHFLSHAENVDSLVIKLKFETDTLKIINYNSRIGNEIIYASPDSAKKFISKAFILAKRINNDTLIYQTTVDMGNVYESKGKLDSAIHFYNIYYNLVKKVKDSLLIASAYNNLGNAYYYKSNYPSSLKYYQKALAIYKYTKDTLYIGLTYHNIGMVHQDMGNAETAFNYYTKAEAIFINKNDTGLLATCYNSLASIYIDDDYDKSMKYYRKSLALFNNIRDSVGVCMVYANIGDVKNDNNEIDSAIYYIEKAANMAYNLNDFFSLTGIYANLSKLKLKQKEYYISIIYSLKSLKYAKLSSSLSSQVDAYNLLKKANYAIENYRDALLYSDSLALMKDSIFNIERTKDIQLMESKYQAENNKLRIKNLENEQELSKEKDKKQKNQLFYMLLILVLVFAFSIFIVRLLISKQKTNKELNISKDNLIEKNEELNQLVEEVTSQKDEIDTQRNKLEGLYSDVSQSISYAQKIQDSLIPDTKLLSQNVDDGFVIFKPKDVVSGDFYWHTKIENKLVIAVSDCTGHGVPGAFMSMLGISFLREIVQKEYITQPALILKKLRKEIIISLKQTGKIGEQKDGMDMSLISIDTDTLELEYAGANNPIYIIKKKKTETNDKIIQFEESNLYEFKADKMPIAIFIRMDKFTNHKIQLEKGDIIYMFSDGFADQFGGEKGKKFKYKSFKNLLLNASAHDMDTQKSLITKGLQDWQGKYSQIDDITLLGLKI